MKKIPSLHGEIRSGMVSFGVGVGVRTELDWRLKNGFGVGSDLVKNDWSWSWSWIGLLKMAMDWAWSWIGFAKIVMELRRSWICLFFLELELEWHMAGVAHLCFKYLGYYVDERLSFNTHCTKMLQKARKNSVLLKFINRSKTSSHKPSFNRSSS